MTLRAPLIAAPTVIASHHKTVYSVIVSHFILFCKYVLSAGTQGRQRTERVFKMGKYSPWGLGL